MERWRQEFDQVVESLRPWSVSIEGRAFVSAGAPVGLRDLYRGLVQVGYARGWL